MFFKVKLKGVTEVAAALAQHSAATDRFTAAVERLSDALAPPVRVFLTLNGITFQGDFKMQLPDNKTVVATLSFVDVRGNPAVVDGAPVWSTDREDVVTVTPAEDGLSAVIAAVGPIGSAQISVSADADLGEGTKELVTLGTVEVIASEAVAGTLNFGEPV